MHVLLTCKNEVDQIKNEGARVFTRFYRLDIWGFSRRSRAANSAVLGLIWPNFELVQDVMDVLVTCQYEEDPIKNRGAGVFTTLYINFSDAQGQITELVVVSGRNLNSSKLSCMPSLPARMRMIDLKMKELECLFVLKILSKNQILTSIKDCDSVANLRETMIYITKVDLVNDYVYTKIVLNRSICFQDIEQKL